MATKQGSNLMKRDGSENINTDKMPQDFKLNLTDSQTIDSNQTMIGGKNKLGVKIDNNEELKRWIRDQVREKVEKEVKFDKASLFTVFGIFASIVTFVSIEIQFLKTICDFWNVVGFSFIILASLLSFILILDYIGRGWRNDFKLEIRQFPWILMIFIILLFATGFISTNFSAKEITCKDEAIFRKYESDFLNKQLELEKVCNDKIGSLRNEINNNRNAIKDLQKYQDLQKNK